MENIEQNFYELIKYVLIISTIISVTIDGFKKHFKSIADTEKVNPIITVVATYIISMIAAFVIKLPMIATFIEKITLGIILGSWSASLYSTAIKAITEIVPTLMKKIK